MYQSDNNYRHQKTIAISRSEPLAMKRLTEIMLPLTLIISAVISIAFVLSLNTIFG